jgi:hypothetical protein
MLLAKRTGPALRHHVAMEKDQTPLQAALKVLGRPPLQRYVLPRELL